MKKILVFILSTALCTSNLLSNDYRSKLDKAWTEKDYTEKLIEELEKKNTKKTRGFLAVAYIMKSNHAQMPWTKLKYFYKGKKLLERSIAESPNNIELIYYRYEIQRRIPKGLNYNHIKHDKELLEAFLKNIKNKNRKPKTFLYPD